jgi:shikimate dehydrogenase
MVSAKTGVFCVLGHPIGHSLSPRMQNAALRAMGLDGIYVAFDVAPERLEEAVRGLRALGARGVNCTIPHKEAVIPLLDEISEEAALIGAVNTIVFGEGGKTTGHNTDAPGFLAALRGAGFEPEGSRAVVLGAGGSARGVVAALVKARASVTLANRTPERARALAERLGGTAVRVCSLEQADLKEALAGADLLVNTTSVGMAPRVGEMPPVPLDSLREGLFVYDLIYNPLETTLLREARRRGARGAHGAGMLAHQGAIALELWTGKTAPVELMERAVLEGLAPAAGQ